jgi:hypothetical protein
VELAKTAGPPLALKWVDSIIAGFTLQMPNADGQTVANMKVCNVKLNTEMDCYSAVSGWMNDQTLNKLFSHLPALKRAVKS